MKAAVRALLIALLATSLFASSVRRADALDIVSIVNAMHAAAPEIIQFSGTDITNVASMVAQCGNSSDTDDVIVCVDAVMQSDVGQDADIPIWVPKAIHVYLDIEHGKFWDLVEDATIAAACAVASSFTGGFDVCGALATLYNMAKDIVADAEAVVQFLEDVGSDIASAANDVYCFFADCDDSTPPPNVAAVTYQQFYAKHIDPDGINARLPSKKSWETYVGGSDTTRQGDIIGIGEKAGFRDDALFAGLPSFVQAVTSIWDSRIIQTASSVRATGDAWSLPAKAAGFVAPGMAKWDPQMTFEMSYANGLAPLLAPGMAACVKDIDDKGGLAVDEWVAEGRPALAHVPGGFTWPSGSQEFCAPFGLLLQKALRPAVVAKATASIAASCPPKNGIYQCGNTEIAAACKSVMSFTGGALSNCFTVNTSAGIIPFVCAGGVIKRAPATPWPPGCRPAQINAPPGSPGGGGPLR